MVVWLGLESGVARWGEVLLQATFRIVIIAIVIIVITIITDIITAIINSCLYTCLKMHKILHRTGLLIVRRA